MRKTFNLPDPGPEWTLVVVWCKMRKTFNRVQTLSRESRLWFDVKWGRLSTIYLPIHVISLVVVWCKMRKTFNYRSELFKTKRVVVWCKMRKTFNQKMSIENKNSVVVWCKMRKTFNVAFLCIYSGDVVVWCKMRKTFNLVCMLMYVPDVVVWCKMRKTFNSSEIIHGTKMLWFDVKWGRLSTQPILTPSRRRCGLM